MDTHETTSARTERLLTEEELARDWLNVDPSLVVRLRSRGEGPPAVRVAPRTIRYRPADVARWLASRTAASGRASAA